MVGPKQKGGPTAQAGKCKGTKACPVTSAAPSTSPVFKHLSPIPLPLSCCLSKGAGKREVVTHPGHVRSSQQLSALTRMAQANSS